MVMYETKYDVNQAYHT